MHILVAEDERKVREFICEALQEGNMVVDTVETTTDLKASVAASSYDVLVLDRLLHGEDSLELISFLKHERPGMGILVLSALGDVHERVQGLGEGADDYLPKPFHVSELLARVRALGRRTDERSRGSRDTLIAYDDLRIDLETQRVFRGEQRIHLTKKELQMLALFARRPGTVFSKAHLLNELWDMNHHPESNIVEVTVANLRAKVDKGFPKPLIHSQRGSGYWLGEP